MKRKYIALSEQGFPVDNHVTAIIGSRARIDYYLHAERVCNARNGFAYTAVAEYPEGFTVKLGSVPGEIAKGFTFYPVSVCDGIYVFVCFTEKAQ